MARSASKIMLVRRSMRSVAIFNKVSDFLYLCTLVTRFLSPRGNPSLVPSQRPLEEKRVTSTPDFAQEGSVIQNQNEQVRGFCSSLPSAHARPQGGSEPHRLSSRLYTAGICGSGHSGGCEEEGGGACGGKGSDVHSTYTRGAAVHVQGDGRGVLLQKT